MNAIVNLSPVRFGAAIATPLFQNDEMIHLSDAFIAPFYKKQSAFAIRRLQEEFADYPVYIHQP
ncbi:hypothetical protein, partial [Streptococcus pneumoniae]